MKIFAIPVIALSVATTPVAAADVSTHVLDLARGVGGGNVPVTLSRRSPDGGWVRIASARTDGDGRVRSFGDPSAVTAGVYRLEFDMSAYPDDRAVPFFPEIVLTFRVGDAAGHYHVPIAVSPYGYSTYRGN